VRTEGNGKDANLDAAIVRSGAKLLSYWGKLGFVTKNVPDAPDTLFLHTVLLEYSPEHVEKNPIVRTLSAHYWRGLQLPVNPAAAKTDFRGQIQG